MRVWSTGAQQAAGSAVCNISGSGKWDMKRVVGECGRVPLLIRLPRCINPPPPQVKPAI
jgi:hypothetical protein